MNQPKHRDFGLSTLSSQLSTTAAAPGRFAVGTEGEILDRFATAAEALRYARGWSEFTASRYDIFDAEGTCLAIVEPKEALASEAQRAKEAA